MKQDRPTSTGGCLCGAVRYKVHGAPRDVVNCHCRMCQRLHGNYGPHSKALKADIELTKSDGLEWYRSSTVARRGFCRICGSQLFWEPLDWDGTGIVAGTLDQPTGLKTLGHIFVGEKPDFYEIDDGLPSFDESSHGVFPGDIR